MSLPSLLFYLGVLLAAPPSARAQHPPVADTLSVSTEASRPPPGFTGPTRRCRGAIDRVAGERPVAQARCVGGFGLPAVTAGQRIARMDGTLRLRITAAASEALENMRVHSD